MGTNDYRYGFNAKELDKSGEFGSLTHYDYGFRIYNPSIAKFLSVDPLTKSYPELTPYQFANNTPIWAVDLDGLEGLVSTGGEPATFNMTARDGTSLKVPIDIRKFGEPKVKHARTQATISVPREEQLKQHSRDQAVFLLNNVVADPQKLKEGDKVEWAGITPIGKVGKAFKAVGILVNIPSKLKWLEKADDVKDFVCSSGCEDVAKKAVKSLGDGAQYLEITSKYNTLGKVAGHDSQWAHHVAAIKDGKVYDKLTGNEGLELEEYKKLFEYADEINFNPVQKLTLK